MRFHSRFGSVLFYYYYFKGRKERKRLWYNERMGVQTLFLQAFVVTALAVFSLGVYQLYFVIPAGKNSCEMTYMNPHYARFSMSVHSDKLKYLNKKYALYRFLQPKYVPRRDALRVSGVPVLFVPGNKGDYKQVRSLGSVADSMSKDIGNGRRLEFFTLDFGEEASAFNGDLLDDQAEYINAAVAAILRLYRKNARGDKKLLAKAPTTVVIVAHSMGGVAARYAFTLDSFRHGTMSTVITLSTPHTRPPVNIDSRLGSLYNEMNNHWGIGARKLAHRFIEAAIRDKNETLRKQQEEAAAAATETKVTDEEHVLSEFDEDEPQVTEEEEAAETSGSTETEAGQKGEKAKPSMSWLQYSKSFFVSAESEKKKGEPKLTPAQLRVNKLAHQMKPVVLVSLAGGKRDTLVDTSLCAVAPVVTPDRGLAVRTEDIPGVKLSIDHQCMCWCNQLMKSIAVSLYNIVDPNTGNVYKRVEERMDVFRENFMPEAAANAAADAGHTLRNGLSRTVPFTHDLIFTASNETVKRAVGGEYGSVVPVATEIVRSYGPFLFPLCLGILLLSFAYQMTMYFPSDGGAYPSMEESLDPNNHLLNVLVGLVQGSPQSPSGQFFSDEKGKELVKKISSYFSVLFFALFVYRSPFFGSGTISEGLAASGSGSTVVWAIDTMVRTVEVFSITSLLPVGTGFPPFWIFCILYLVALGLLRAVILFAKLVQKVTGALRFPTMVEACAPVYTKHQRMVDGVFWIVSVFLVGHLRLEHIVSHGFNYVLSNARPFAFSRELGALLLVITLSNLLKGVRFIFLSSSQEGTNQSFANYQFSIGLLLVFTAPFHVPVALKCLNTIATDRGYQRGIFDLTITFGLELGSFMLARMAGVLPMRCSSESTSGKKMYYGIEIGPMGPSPQQGEAIRNAVWKDTKLREIRDRSAEIDADYNELVELTGQVEIAVQAGPPKAYDAKKSKDAIHLHRLCATLSDVKMMSKLLKMDLIEHNGNQEVRMGRKACTWKLNRYLNSAEKLSKVSKLMHDTWEALDDVKNQNGEGFESSDAFKATLTSWQDKWSSIDGVEAYPPARVSKETDVLDNLAIFENPYKALVKKNPVRTGDDNAGSGRSFFGTEDFDFLTTVMIYITCLIGGYFCCLWGLLKMHRCLYFVSSMGMLLMFREQ